jgi:lipopolysaccharide biosynthesis protein
VKLIAFYLPQYHPIAENDRWWGTGFTEWTNVARARPRFRGHQQPRIPADLGFYDLRVPEVREAQAELARAHGIHGFCYYHYWFNGKRLLERPFNEVLVSGRPDFPFCLCWANEHWTRAWDGGDREILIGQNYGDDDDRAHIQSLIPALRDPRYIRLAGRPLVLIYRTEIMPNAARTAEIWREEAHKAGVGDLYLARVESFSPKPDPRSIGFDAAIEFAPDWRKMVRRKLRDAIGRAAYKLRVPNEWYRDDCLTSYDALVQNMVAKPSADYPWFRCVTPGFDNSPRRRREAVIFLGSTPAKYRAWLGQTIQQAVRATPAPDEPVVFINAWNEWGEGNYLEPDLQWGLAYLEATRDALADANRAGKAA